MERVERAHHKRKHPRVSLVRGDLARKAACVAIHVEHPRTCHLAQQGASLDHVEQNAPCGLLRSGACVLMSAEVLLCCVVLCCGVVCCVVLCCVVLCVCVLRCVVLRFRWSDRLKEDLLRYWSVLTGALHLDPLFFDNPLRHLAPLAACERVVYMCSCQHVYVLSSH